MFIFLVALIVLVVNVNDAWTKTEPWEQKWIANKNVEQEYDSEKLILAIKSANEQHEYSDAYTLEETLNNMYKPSGEVLIRFNTVIGNGPCSACKTLFRYNKKKWSGFQRLPR